MHTYTHICVHMLGIESRISNCTSRPHPLSCLLVVNEHSIHFYEIAKFA